MRVALVADHPHGDVSGAQVPTGRGMCPRHLLVQSLLHRVDLAVDLLHLLRDLEVVEVVALEGRPAAVLAVKCR